MRIRAALLILTAASAAGCGPAVVREPIHQGAGVDVGLRRVLDGGKPVPRGFEHPAIIAPVRLSHILASLTHEDRAGRRRPTIRAEHVHELAQGLGEAFERAGPDDEIVACATSRDRRLSIFTVDRVTCFRGGMLASQLVLDFYSVEEELERGTEGKVEVPLEPPAARPAFRLIAGEGIAVAGPRSLVIDWRDPHFRRPVSLRSGRGQGRTILMQSEPEAEPPPPPLPEPPDLSDAQRGALDQLDAARRAGLVTEAEFQRRLRLILEGRLDDAGYGRGAP